VVSADDGANRLAYTMPALLVQHSGLGAISRQAGHPLPPLPAEPWWGMSCLDGARLAMSLLMTFWPNGAGAVVTSPAGPLSEEHLGEKNPARGRALSRKRS
jgi:hypothetical protein